MLLLGPIELHPGTLQAVGGTLGLEGCRVGQGSRNLRGPCVLGHHAGTAASDLEWQRDPERPPDSTAWRETSPLREGQCRSGSRTCLIWKEPQQYQTAAGCDACYLQHGSMRAWSTR